MPRIFLLLCLFVGLSVSAWAQCGQLVANPVTGLLDCAGLVSGSAFVAGQTNGVVYVTGAGFAVTSTNTGGAGTLCLTSVAGAAPAWGACSGSAATAFSAITTGTNNTPLVMGTGGSLTTSGTGTISATSINGVLLSTLATAPLKITTGTGAPSASVAADIVGLFTGCSGTQSLGADGACHTTGPGTVTSVSFTGGLISVATATTTPAFTVAGTSGGIPYFSTASTWASSAALTAHGVLIGEGAGASPVATAAGTAGQVLTSNGPAADPTFQTITGTGTVTVVGAGSLTNTALVTGGGGTTVQTPSTTATMDSSGNISTPGSGSFGVGSGSAGAVQLQQGTAITPAANSFGWTAPTSMTTSVVLRSPNAVPAANQIMLFGAPSANISDFVWTNYFSPSVNLQSGANYAIVSADGGKLVSLTNGSAQTPTLPNATTLPAGWFVSVENRGAGTQTITPATSTIDGAASLALTTNQGVQIFSDGTNYFTQRGVGGAGGTPALDAVTNLTATKTFADGNFQLAFNCAMTTVSQACLSFGETTAATGAGDIGVNIQTLNTSTAVPLVVTQGSGPAGANSPAVWQLTGGTGGANTGATSAGFKGGGVAVTTGNGSNAGATSGTGGAAGDFQINTGNGGTAAVGSTTGKAGDVILNLGAAGATGTLGAPGQVKILGNTVGGANTTPFLNLTGTWNTTGVVTGAITAAITDTASGALSKVININGGAAATTNLFNVDKTGLGYFGTGLQMGATPPAGTAGTAGVWFCGEGTAPTGLGSSDILWCDSGVHRWKMLNNNGTATQVVASGADINTSDQVTATHIAGFSSTVIPIFNATGNIINSDFQDISNKFQSSVSNVTSNQYTGGQDSVAGATTLGSATLRGSDVTSGATAASVAGATILRGGDNASTATTGTTTAGNITIRPGQVTATAGSAQTNGTLQIQQTAIKGGTYTAGNLGCISAGGAAITISDCTAATNSQYVGVNAAANGNAATEVTHGLVSVNSSASTTYAAGDLVCTDSANAAKVVDNVAVPCPANQPQVGVAAGDTGAGTAHLVFLQPRNPSFTSTQTVSAADYANATTTPSTLFTWTLPATPTARNYYYSCEIMWLSTTATAVGPVFGLNISAAPTQLTGNAQVSTAVAGTYTTAYLSNTTTGSQTLITSAVAAVQNTNYPAKIWGTIEGAAAAGSTFTINAAATSAFNLGIRRGSFCILAPTP